MARTPAPSTLKLVCAQQPDKVSEKDLTKLVVDMARDRGWLVTHFRPAQDSRGNWKTPLQGDPGFPDLVLARAGVVIFAELKREKEKPRPDQEAWLRAVGSHSMWMPDGSFALMAPEHAGVVWRPSDIAEIEKALA